MRIRGVVREPLAPVGISTRTLVQADNISKTFAVSKGLFAKTKTLVHAVDGVSFQIAEGESLGIVGESGSGKTTVGRMLLKLIEPSSGSAYFRDCDDGVINMAGLRGRGLKRFRRQAQMVFQDPYESMNPRRTIFDTVAEPLAVQRIGGVSERLLRVNEMLERVGLAPVNRYSFRYPHELSGGQRQRAAIARALVLNPAFVVADEPTSMLDVSMRAGIMRLMKELAHENEISYLYITHDLAVARYMCDRVAVMYMGKIVEMAQTEDLLKNPLHPYTRALLSAIPSADPKFKRPPVNIIETSAAQDDLLSRCRFYARCPAATETCRSGPHPPLMDKGEQHAVACYNT